MKKRNKIIIIVLFCIFLLKVPILKNPDFNEDKGCIATYSRCWSCLTHDSRKYISISEKTGLGRILCQIFIGN